MTFQVDFDLKIGGFSYEIGMNSPAEKNCEPGFFVIDKLYIIYLRHFCSIIDIL